MAKIGDIFITEYKSAYDVDFGQVTEIVGDTVTWTPIYQARHNMVFFTLSLGVVDAAIEETNALRAAEDAEQAAEYAAEMNIPQHLVW